MREQAAPRGRHVELRAASPGVAGRGTPPGQLEPDRTLSGIVVPPAAGGGLAGRDAQVSAATAARMAAGRPAETARAYERDARRFADWCAQVGRTAWPATPATVAEYLSHLADRGLAPATLERALASIRAAHRAAGLPPPETAPALLVLRGYRKQRAQAGQPNARRAAPLSVRQLRELVGVLNAEEVTGLRDRTLLVVGWAMFARRSELVGLDVGDVAEVEQGLLVTVRTSKTDKNSAGRQVALPYGSRVDTCPVRLMRAWLAVLAAHGIESGPLFRRIDRHGNIAGAPGGARAAGRGPADGRLSGQAVGMILVRAAAAAGLDATGLRAHSLRAGGATGAYTAGGNLLAIARHGGWADGSPVLLRYIRGIDQWQHNPLIGTGL